MTPSVTLRIAGRGKVDGLRTIRSSELRLSEEWLQ